MGRIGQNNRLVSSTIMEIVVALLLVSLLFSIAFQTIQNINQNSIQFSELRAMQLARNALVSSIQSNRLVNEEWEENHFYYKKTCASFSGDSTLVLVRVEVCKIPTKTLYEAKAITHAP